MLANTQDNQLIGTDQLLDDLGQIANMGAAREAITDYINRKSVNTLRRHRNDLINLATFFGSLIKVDNEFNGALIDLSQNVEKFAQELKPNGNPNPNHLAGLTWGMIKKWQDWLTSEGYAINSINAHLSSIKIYAKLASQADAISASEIQSIMLVRAYSQKEGKRIDEKRPIARLGAKKQSSILITSKQAETLKTHPDTPQGIRDALLMSLLLDHGLRVSEVALLELSSVDINASKISFYRPKTDSATRHEMTRSLLLAATKRTITANFSEMALVPGSVKGGKLSDKAMSARAITKRVRYFGKKMLGIENLSAHDCRHYAATRLAPKKNIKELMTIFGWTSPAMAARYIEESDIVTLD